MKRGIFDKDVMVAIVAVMAIALLASNAIERQAHRAADTKKTLELSYNALEASEFVASKCKGLPQDCTAELQALNATAEIRFFGQQAKPDVLKAGNTVCITRILDAHKYAEVCAT